MLRRNRGVICLLMLRSATLNGCGDDGSIDHTLFEGIYHKQMVLIDICHRSSFRVVSLWALAPAPRRNEHLKLAHALRDLRHVVLIIHIEESVIGAVVGALDA